MPLVCLDGRPETLAAALRYLLFALFGSVLYLLGTALLYGSYGTLDIVLLAYRINAEPLVAPAVWVAAGLMTAGLLAKAALFPLHLWLPPAHANAPAAASAVLSALVVKASFFLIVRLWFDVMPGLASQAVTTVLATLGAAAILFGSVLALRQARLKLLIAYSTVAQIGYLFLMFPLVAGGHPWSAEAWNGGVMQTLSHAFAKAAMFLAAGLVAEQLGHDRIAELRGIGRAMPMTVFAFGLGGLSLMGLPPSGGFAAKWLLLQASVESGQWVWAVVMLAGGLLAGGYVYRVIAPALASASVAVKAPASRRREARGAGAGARRGAARVSRRTDSSTCCRSAGRSPWWLCNERRRHAGPVLLVATLATPLVLLLACLSRRLRDSMPALLVLAPLPGLAAALLAIGGTPLAFDQPQLKISLALDVPGAILLGVAALLWSAAGVYAFTDLRGKAEQRALCRVLAADPDRQSRRLHRRRPFGLLSRLRPGQPARLWTDRA